MKRFMVGLAIALGAMTICGTAKADPIDFTLELEQQPALLMSAGDPRLELVFDLTTVPEWNSIAAQSDITAWITLNFGDNKDRSAAKVTFDFEDGIGFIDRNIKSHPVIGTTFAVNSSAFSDDKVWASLEATKGDFYFRSATLHVTGLSLDGEAVPAMMAAPVPEPGSMLLVGTGLLALAGVLRRQKKA